jgi:RNA polymerase sigma-70 factor (ECF subfamily)
VDVLQTAIAHAHAAARTAWPGCTLELARFGSELIRRLGADFDPAKLGAICTEDVYLAVACLDGDPTAIGYLERDCLVEVDRAGRKLRATDDQIAEIRGHLRQILFTAEPGRLAALAGFTGRGDLRGYLRVIATRELIRAINRGRREDPFEEASDPLLGRLDLSRAPELGLLRARHGEAISAALRAALDLLDERQRALLRYSLIDGWSIDRIGELYDVHRATASRWVTAARDALGEHLRREVSARLAIPLEDVDSIVRAVHSQIDISLARIL